MKKAIIFVSILVLILTTAVIPASAQDYSSYVDLNCEIDYMVSLDDDSVVISKNAQKKAAPASMTKITTALVVLQNCPDLNETVTVSENAIRVLLGTGSSLSGLKAGEQMSVLNMLHCLLVPSGNDAAVVLAEHVAGSQEKFVQMMNECAQKLGCKNTHYDNPHGLDSETHYTTAEDIAIISKAALEYNAFKNIVCEARYTLPATNMNKERTLINTNSMLNSAYITYYRSFVKGIKTGHTDDAGYCVATYASKDGYNYLAVAMNGDYRDSDNDNIQENQAFMDSIRMYEWAFANLSYELVAPKDMMVAEVGINYSWKTDHIQLKPKEDFRTLVPTGTDEGSVLIEPIEKPETVDAPVKAGDVACKAKVIYADTEIATIDLVYSQSVSKNYLLYAWSLLMRLLSSTVFKIILVLAVAGVAIYIGLVMRSNAVRKKKKNQLKIVKINDMEKAQNTKKQDRNYKPRH